MNFALPKENSVKTVEQKISKSTASYVQVFLLVVIVGLSYWFLIKPKQAEVAVQQKQLEVLKAEETKLSSNTATLKKLVAELKKEKDKIKNLDEALPLNGKTFGINTVLEEYAKQAGVILAPANLNPKPDYIVAGNVSLLEKPFGSKRSLQKLSTNLNILGEFPQLINFLTRLENSPRLIQINDFELADDKEGLLNLNISVDVYFYE
jgi:Tfp pilus assembly protein PilO